MKKMLDLPIEESLSITADIEHGMVILDASSVTMQDDPVTIYVSLHRLPTVIQSLRACLKELRMQSTEA